MSDNGFEFAGRKFKLNKIDAIKQFHIARRIAPILAELIPQIGEAAKYQDVKDLEKVSESKKMEMVAKFASPVMMGLSKISDADANHVLYGLLEAVEVKQEPIGNWARVSSNSLLLMQDLDLRTLVQLAGRAFMFNLSGFFGALPQ